MAQRREKRSGVIKECPKCGAEIPLKAQGMPKYSKLSLMIFAAAAVVTIFWIIGIYLWSPIWLVPRSGRGFLVCAVVYLGPGVALGSYAASLAKIKTIICRKCKWTKHVTVRR